MLKIKFEKIHVKLNFPYKQKSSAIQPVDFFHRILKFQNISERYENFR